MGVLQYHNNQSRKKLVYLCLWMIRMQKTSK